MTDQESTAGTTPPQAATGIATEALIVPVAPVPGSSRGRWLVALGVAGVAIAATVAAVLLLGGRGTPEALRYVPRDALFVAELRLDLPGDQRQRVGNLLAHFPGFADQSTLDLKIDEAMERIVATVTNGQLDYQSNLKPWLAGPVLGAVRLAGVTPSGSPTRGVIVATTDGGVTCETAFPGRPMTRETHRGLEVLVVQAEDLGCLIADRSVVIGDVPSVRAAIDAHADGTGMDRNTTYTDARAALAGEQLATMYVSGAGLERVQADVDTELRPFADAALPAWSIAGLRAEDDALVLDMVTAPISLPSAAASLRNLPPAHASGLARHVPDGALAFVEAQGAGTLALNGLDALRADSELGPTLVELDSMLESLGGVEQLVGWVDDAGVALVGGPTPDDVAGGVLLLAPDEATAKARTDTYRALLGLAAIGGQLEVRTSTVGELELTTVTLRDGSAQLAGEPLAVSFATKGRLVAVGTSQAFVTTVLAIDGAGSLAESDRYRAATARAIANPRAAVYVNAQGSISLVRAQLPPDQAALFETEYLPYLSPITAIHVSATDAGGAARARFVVYVTTPQNSQP